MGVTNSAGPGPPAAVVVLAFLKSDHPDATPNARLCDFVREARVTPGETRAVKLCVGGLGDGALATVDEAGKAQVVPGNYTVTVGVKGGVGGDGAGAVIGTLVVTP